MSQFYLNGPSVGRAMSAEEFAKAAGKLPEQCPGTPCPGTQPCPPANGCGCGVAPVQPVPPTDCCCSTPVQPMPPAGCGCNCGNMPSPVPPAGCGCGGTTPDCPDNGCGQSPAYCQQMICCCYPATTTNPQPPQVNEGCCCKQSFRAALSLLCDQQVSSVLDFDTAAFLTDTYSAGATITPITPPADGDPVPPADNLGTALTGSFRRFAPGSCDLLDVDGEISDIAGTAVGLTARQVSLCQLAAVAIQAATAAAEGDLSAEEVMARNFRCLRQRLAQQLNSCGACGESGCSCGACGENSCSCSCACSGEECCCAAGLLTALAQNNLSRRVSLVAGLLALQNVTLLGTVGNVLVLANDTDNRLYFVCVNSVQFVS